MVLAGIAKLSHPQAHVEANVCALAQSYGVGFRVALQQTLHSVKMHLLHICVDDVMACAGRTGAPWCWQASPS